MFVSAGVLYAELRAAIAGYETKDGRFTFNDACVCAQEAFGYAPEYTVKTGMKETIAWYRK
jgi:nucleoside-diphosphate-sugar epimerase